MSPDSNPGNPGITGVTFDSSGHRLVGAAYLARGDEPRPTVLLLHGCPGFDQHGDLAADLREAGWNALIFHYRGCWGSAGRYDVGMLTADVRAAVDFLSAAPFPGVDPDRLVVAGHSMGGWAAIQAAASDERIRATIAMAAPARLDGFGQLADADIEREFTRFLAATPGEFRGQLAAAASRPGPLELIAAVSPRPVLIVHGGADEWVSPAEGRELYERARPPRGHVELPGANHAFSWHRAELRGLVLRWLAQTGLGGLTMRRAS